MQNLDQFYTKPSISNKCWKSLAPVLCDITGKKMNELFFIEPSAGKGDFYDLLPDEKRIGADIVPMREEFIRADFLTWNYKAVSKADTIIVGNPPFGRRGDLAVQFINKASDIADTIAFIVPVIFRKYFIHKLINKDLQWIHSADLPREAFYTNNKETYQVNTEFQVWTRLKTKTKPYTDRRLLTPPPIKHPDFIMWQYNNTKQALKMFKNDFDFAVPSQGWQDYTRRERKADKCEKHKQWMLFKALKKTVRDRLYDEIDYITLAMKNTTSIPGFRKGDVVQEYIQQYS